MLGRLAGRQIRPSLNRRPAAPDRLPDSTIPLPCRVWRAHTGPISGLVSSLAAFTAPVSLPTIYKNPTSLPPKLRRTFTSVSPSPSLLSPPWTRCNAVSLVKSTAPFHSTVDAAPSATQPVLASGDTMRFMPLVLRCLR